MKTVIMAGGMGTRVAGIAPGVPKPMLPVAGKPILEHQIERLRESRLTDILLVVGHLGGAIKNYFGDGRRFGVTIEYFTEDEPLGTAGALFACTRLLSRDFLLINGDIIFDIDFLRLFAAHEKNAALATIVSHPNSHPFDSALLVTDGENRIVRWMSKEEPRGVYQNRVNSGLHIISRDLIERAARRISAKKIDLDRDVLKAELETRRIFAYDTSEYIKDMGTPERYARVEKDIQNNFVAARNLNNKQKAVFLDRDGTLNRLNGFITTPDELELLEGAAEAVRAINDAGYLAIVTTNQPVIARGECTLEELGEIHKKLETLLGKQGAYIDALYFCPHHPHKGFPGERPWYKRECECRKPKPGMLFEAAKQFNIDLGASWMAGDKAKDVRAGKAAGCKTALIQSEESANAAEAAPDIICESLLSFVEAGIF